jgi:signal transduction histidine kinase
MSRRLMGLQRQRLTQNQVVDRRTRRMLHDEVLPRLHATMLTLPQGSEAVVEQLAEIHHQIADLLHELPTAAAPEVARLGLLPALRDALDSELGSAFDGVTWNIDPQAAAAAQSIPLLTAEVVYYAVREAMRNAAIYGRGDQPKRPLHLCVEVTQRDSLSIRIEDDGVGLERTSKASDASRDSTLQGSGHGLALHSTMMAVIGGSLTVESTPNQFTRVTVSIPRD